MGQHEIPESFFMDLDDTVPVRNTFGNEGKPGWTPAGAMKWYDQIIDDLLANPGTDLTACAKRLGRSPSTVQTIVRSDLFQARYGQRRQAYEDELNRRMVSKLTRAAELSLDATIETLEKKRDTIPLPLLNEVTKTTLDRLGYGPSRSDSASVVIQNNNNVVSAEALAAARDKLRLVESVSVAPPAQPSRSERPFNVDPRPSAPVAGRESEVGEED